MIDLNALRATLARAQQEGAAMVTIHYTELQSLLHQVQSIQAIKEHIPKVFGYCKPDDIRTLCNSRERFGRIKRKPWAEYCVPVYFIGELPKQEMPEETPLAAGEET